ncbi:MAG: DUF1064 domain-containing protein [Eubacteriales bacterium]|nr:DUF1064 domain-containing protein [Eubacteriales bacterium]MDD4513763.1 DUF1064 domain-containing protein [Eubacteriales bacterium]
MSGEFTEEWLKAYCARTGQPMPRFDKNPSHDKVRPGEGDAPTQPRRSKYGNQRTEIDGEVYDSKHEAEIAKQLMYRGGCGEFKAVARQVPFFLPGGVKYVADFVVLLPDGSYQVLDAKSEATKQNAVYRLKKRQMRECLGIEIQEV